ELDHAVIVHVLTQKGKGYGPAEATPTPYHGVDPFDIKTGKTLKKKGISYTKLFAEQLIKEAADHPELTAITAAMPDGTGLSAFQKAYPERFFDVGIAEQNAVTMAAGMACAGLHPVAAIYSSFLQRAYDQLSHDVCLQKLPVIFALDRAGFVGSDGETHHGIFDLSYLSHLPNMTVMAPKNGEELQAMIHFAANYMEGPIAVRYPRGEAYTGFEGQIAPVEYGKAELLHQGRDIALLGVGSMMSCAGHLHEKILQENGKEVALVNMRFVKPLDTELLDQLAADCKVFVTMEENVFTGGMGSAINDYMMQHHPECRMINIAIPDKYVEQGNIDILKHNLGMDSESIYERIKEFI
ncbi:MAG: 1-deoxy-D-xylulose-5-phosphate synthase, partial [Lachnospiraceae bacterium]|nr:1-deoxy-D-xylulose-5-phosphate synthase [Candidatus Equihabitans merdae]